MSASIITIHLENREFISRYDGDKENNLGEQEE